MDYVIEKSIEMPARISAFPFFRMDVGDSFGFPIEDAKRVRANASASQRKHKRRYKILKVSDDKMRCWRIE